MADRAGEGASGGDVEEGVAYSAKAGAIDDAARRDVEARGRAIFLAGTPQRIAACELAPSVEAALSEELLKACGGSRAEVTVSLLTITSPEGDYFSHPMVKGTDR